MASDNTKDEKRKVVLVADDERLIADTLVKIFREVGYEAYAVYHGSGALEMAESLRPDFLISDVIMPDMTGIDVAILLRRFLPSCKIFLYSGQAATVDLMEEAREKHGNFAERILPLPVQPQIMLEWLASGGGMPDGHDAVEEYRAAL